MQRRTFVIAAAAGAPLAAMAHHGWSSFDQDHPIYLEGKVTAVRWQNPHAELEIEVPADLKLPADLGLRPLPAQTAPVDGKAVVTKAAVPRRKDRKWEIELAPLTRMQAWKVAEIRPGTNIALVGFTFPGEKGSAVARVEYLFVDGKTYALRSGPA